MKKLHTWFLIICFLVIPSKILGADTDQANILAAEQSRVQNMLDNFVISLGKDPALYHITVEKSDVLNAYATIGRKIVVFSGLIESLDNDPALAFVIAHELGHIEEKHAIHGMVRQGFIALIKSFFTSKPNVIRVYEGVTYIGELHYSRGSEKEADLFAVKLMNELYCNKAGKLEFFEDSLADQEKELKISEYFSTHPLSSTRLEYLREAITEAGCKV